jgi:twinkle protein
MGQVLLGLARSGEVTCNLSMEMPPGKTLQRQCLQAVGGPPTIDYQTRFIEWSRGRLFLSNFDRPMTPESILGAIAWAATHRNCTQFVVDSLMKCGVNEDDYNGQKNLVTHLAEFAKSLDIHIWLVAHGRKKDDELKVMDKFDIKGTGTITDMADNVITVFRNKRKERALAQGITELDNQPIEKKADALMRCDKQRHGDWEGTVPLNFHNKSGQFIPFNEKYDRPMDISRKIILASGRGSQRWSPARQMNPESFGGLRRMKQKRFRTAIAVITAAIAVTKTRKRSINSGTLAQRKTG